MAKNNFLTDKFSTTGSLAAVAYGSSELFYSVADQIRAGSISKPLDDQLPSNLVLDYVNTKSLLKESIYNILEVEYNKNNEFTDFIDIFCNNSLDNYSVLVSDNLLLVINSISDYNSNLVSILEDSLEMSAKRCGYNSELELDFVELAKQMSVAIAEENYLMEDLNLILLLAANNPVTKITSAPPDQLVPLSAEGKLGKTYNGVDINVGTVSIINYYQGRSAYNSDDSVIKDVVSQGYVGYPLAALLGESLLDKDNIEYYSVSTGTSANEIEDPLYNINLATINISN